MPKKYNLKFTPDVETFLKNNPAFAINKPSPNTGAIRAVLREGGVLEGVSLVEAPENVPASPMLRDRFTHGAKA